MSQKISLSMATIIGLNGMIGAGIFTIPAALATTVGPAGILTFAFVSISVWFMASSFARVAELHPEEGSFYIYAKQWGGHAVGIIACASYLIGLIIGMALLSQLAGSYLHELIPNVSPEMLGLITLLALTVLNLFGVKLSAVGQYVLIVCTVFPIIAITLMCLFKFNYAHLTPFAPFGYNQIIKAARIVVFGFFGFEAAASLFSQVENPKRNVPKALTYSILIVSVLYTLFFSSIISAIPFDTFTDPEMPLTEALRTIFPNFGWLLTLILLAILAAIIGTVHSMLWSSAALLVSLVKKMSTPAVSFSHEMGVLAVSSAILVSFFLFKNINLFFYFTSAFITAALILAIMTLLFKKDEWRSGKNIQTLIGLATALVIFSYSLQGIINTLR